MGTKDCILCACMSLGCTWSLRGVRVHSPAHKLPAHKPILTFLHAAAALKLPLAFISVTYIHLLTFMAVPSYSSSSKLFIPAAIWFNLISICNVIWRMQSRYILLSYLHALEMASDRRRNQSAKLLFMSFLPGTDDNTYFWRNQHKLLLFCTQLSQTVMRQTCI